MEENSLNKIGAVWLRDAKSGMKYMSGQLELDGVKHNITIFKNKKQQDNHPDYQIFSETLDSGYRKQEASTQPAGETNTVDEDDGIPF